MVVSGGMIALGIRMGSEMDWEPSGAASPSVLPSTGRF